MAVRTVTFTHVFSGEQLVYDIDERGGDYVIISLDGNDRRRFTADMWRLSDKEPGASWVIELNSIKALGW